MASLMWLCAWVLVFAWSLICWAAFGLVDVTAALAEGSSGIITSILPGSESIVRMVIGLADNVGEGIVVALWLGGSACVLGGTWLIAGVFGAARPSLATARLPEDKVGPSRWPATAAPMPSAADDVLGRLARRGIRAAAAGPMRRP